MKRRRDQLGGSIRGCRNYFGPEWGFPDCRQIFKFPKVPHFKDGHHEIAMIAGCPGIVPEVGLDIMHARRSVNVRLTPTPFLYRGQEPFPVIREFFELTRGVKDSPKYQHPHCQDFPVEAPPGTLPQWRRISGSLGASSDIQPLSRRHHQAHPVPILDMTRHRRPTGLNFTVQRRHLISVD